MRKYSSSSKGNIDYSKLYYSQSRSTQVGGHKGGVKIHDSLHLAGDRAFAQQTRAEVMLSNLKSGLMYVDRQKESLSEIGKIIDTWRFSMEHDIQNSDVKNINNFKNIIYIDPIANLVNQRFKNRLLFGNGTEPSVRINIMINGNKYEFHLNVVPLLIDPGFQAIMHSGRSHKYPSNDVFNMCCRHIINCMLDLEHNRAELDEKLRLVAKFKEKNTNVTALIPNDSTNKYLQVGKSKKAVFERVISFLVTKFPVTSMAGIILPLTLIKKF